MRTLALILALSSFGCVPHIDRGPISAEVGMRPVPLLELPDPSSPNIYLQALIKAGSAYDPVGQEGLAHLTASSLVEGGAGEHTADELRAILHPTGNFFSTHVDREFVSLRLRCHKDHAALCVGAFVDVLTSPQFNGDDVQRTKDEALYTVTEGLLSNEEALGDAVFQAALFDGHPYGHPVEGRAGSLPGLDANRVKQFYTARYLRPTVWVGIAGGYQEQDIESLKTALESIPGSIPPDDAKLAPVPVNSRQLLAVQTNTALTGYHIGHLHEVDRNHPDWPALYLATLHLGAHRQSFGRLFESIRTQRGLNYGNYAYMESFTQRGWSTFPQHGTLIQEPIFYLWLRPTSIENGPFALKLAIEELEHWVQHGLTESQLETTRQYALGHLPLEAQSAGERLARQLDALATGTPQIQEELTAQIKTVDLATVNAAIVRHISPETLWIVSVTGDADSLQTALTADAPTPIFYSDVSPGEEQAAKDKKVSEKDLGISLENASTIPAMGIFR